MTNKEINWKAKVEEVKDDLLKDLVSLLQIDSVRDDDAASEEYPVGPGPAKALDHFLELAERDGFETENFDNWAGHIDLGQGEETLGILAHVDVVPVGSGWDSNPFQPIIKDNRLYARGSSDDKGPGMAAYYAMKIVRSLDQDLSKKIRFIIGTDEESDWQCMDHYFSINPQPDYGFSPDAHFPIINGEKGNVSVHLKQDAGNVSDQLSLKRFESGLRENMVPQDAEAVLVGGDDQDKLVKAFEDYCQSAPVQGQAQVNGEELVLSVVGKASHGATPEAGENAGTYLADFLNGQGLEASGKDFVAFLADQLHDDPYAEKTDLAIEDEVMGQLTMNIGIMSYEAGQEGQITVNFRYPDNTDADTIVRAFEDQAPSSFTVSCGDDKVPHYVSGDDPLVKTLLDVYERQTGLEGHEVMIGGGTYARTIDRGVAYGAMFPDSIDTMHQANEFIDLDDLFNATAIYAEAIYELAK